MVPQDVVQAFSREPTQPQPGKKYPSLTLPPSSGREGLGPMLGGLWDRNYIWG